MKEKIGELIKAAEACYGSASAARKSALEACIQAGSALDKAKQAEADARQLLNLLQSEMGSKS